MMNYFKYLFLPLLIGCTPEPPCIKYENRLVMQTFVEPGCGMKIDGTFGCGAMTWQNHEVVMSVCVERAIVHNGDD